MNLKHSGGDIYCNDIKFLKILDINVFRIEIHIFKKYTYDNQLRPDLQIM